MRAGIKQLIDKWKKGSPRGAAGNASFEGNNFYSYGRRVVMWHPEQRLVLSSSAGWGATTQKHISDIAYGIVCAKAMCLHIKVPRIDEPTHRDNEVFLREQALALMSRAALRRKLDLAAMDVGCARGHMRDLSDLGFAKYDGDYQHMGWRELYEAAGGPDKAFAEKLFMQQVKWELEGGGR